jgi:hypothetical protein
MTAMNDVMLRSTILYRPSPDSSHRTPAVPVLPLASGMMPNLPSDQQWKELPDVR